MDDSRGFSSLLRMYRQQTETTQEEVAQQLGISRNYLSQIERGIAKNISWGLGTAILNLWHPNETGQIEIVVPRRILVDAALAIEIEWLNVEGVETEGCCIGPPPLAMIRPGSVTKARELGYVPEYQPTTGLYQIRLRSEGRNAAAARIREVQA